EVFEVVIDRLEKEWFNLVLPPGQFPSDEACAICDDSEGENNNAIVFCDGCNVAVHQGVDCYGVPYIPEGQWLCRPCTVSLGTPVSCILCPDVGGAFKQTAQAEWIHLLCAIWIPETCVSNNVFMEPIIGVEGISKQRWKLVSCNFCSRHVPLL
ncbi:PHD-zinc-finger like domain-containing protein, partial [Mycena leptocephala]